MKNIERLAQKKLEEILLDDGYVERGKLEDCLRVTRSQAKSLPEVLVSRGILEEMKLAQILSNRLQLPYLSLNNWSISPDLVKKIPQSLMAKYCFVPLDEFEDVLTILVADVFSTEMIDEIQKVTQTDLYVYIGTISDVMNTLKQVAGAAGPAQPVQTPAPQQAELTSGWESMFEVADQSVQDELKKKAPGESQAMVAPNVVSPAEVTSGWESIFDKGGQNAHKTAGAEEGAAEAPKAEVTSGWEAVFDMGEQSVQEERATTRGGKPSKKEEEPPAENFEEILVGSQQKAEPSGKQPREAPKEESSNAVADPRRTKMAELAAHLSKNNFDYDAMNEYVELALDIGDNKAAVRQLTLFALGLEQAGRPEEAKECFEYILDLDPNNREAKSRLQK